MDKEFISTRVKNIKPSPTMAVTAKAIELKKAGKDVIGLGAGEPDFDTPQHIKKAAIKAINEGKTKYTVVDGIAELKEAIVEKFKRDNNLSFSSNQISVATGGKQILFNALQATLNEGDEVIIPAPYWVSYTDMTVLAGGKPIIIPTTYKNDFKLETKNISNFITNKTKWIIINSPSNPTGVSYTEKEMEEIANVIEKFPNLMVLSDDIYEKITYDDFKFKTIAEVNPRIKDRVLTVNGVSKAYSMTGWRIGYAGGPTTLIKSMAKIQSQSTSNPTSISQYAALEALKSEEAFISENNNLFNERRNLIVEQMNLIDGITCNVPNGAFYIFPSCFGLFGKVDQNGNKIQNSNDFCSFLLENAGVATVPGIAFGLDGHFRISYATSTSLLIESGKRIKEACKKLR